MLRADVCGRDQRQFDEIHAIINATVLGHDAGLRGLRDARRRHDPTGPLRHRHFRLLAVSKITPCSNLRRIGFHVLRVHQRQGHDLREHVR